jgi:hypothetical protein
MELKVGAGLVIEDRSDIRGVKLDVVKERWAIATLRSIR